MNTLALLLVTLLLVAVFVNDAEACGRRRRRRRRGWVNRPPIFGGVTPTPRPTPQPTPKPTPAPTPHPTPAYGFQPRKPGENEFDQGRTNCVRALIHKEVSGVGQPSAGESGSAATPVEEVWEYRCSFNVCTEIELEAMDSADTPCACGVKLALNDKPDTNVQGAEKSYAPEVDAVRFVIYNPDSNTVLGEIEEFNALAASNSTTNSLKQGAIGGRTGITNVVAGFSGKVTFQKTPALLEKKDGQEVNVPAMCFRVTQKFESKYKWQPPAVPRLHEAPNVYATDCSRYDPKDPFRFISDSEEAALMKRANGAKGIWTRRFFVFAADNVANKKNSRELVAYYLNSDCTTHGASGAAYVTFVREFQHKISRHRQAYGSFAWERIYQNHYLVMGVPKKFDAEGSFFNNGFVKITWEPMLNRPFNPAMHLPVLMGDVSKGDEQLKNDNLGEWNKICDKIPANWEPIATEDPYGENSVRYPTHADLQCGGYMKVCDVPDHSILAFQNFGKLQRHFSKTSDAHLLTSPRSSICSTAHLQYDDSLKASVPVFDPLPCKPISIGTTLQKRSTLMEPKVDNGDWTQDPVTGERKASTDPIKGAEPVDEQTETLVDFAVGSATDNGLPGGDHPFELFSEQYAVPLPLEQDAECANGISLDSGLCPLVDQFTRPLCIQGSLGCTCRNTAQTRRPACDAPFSCESGFCARPACPAGEPGCACKSGACNSGEYKCNAASVCTIKDPCAKTPFAPGCKCPDPSAELTSCVTDSTCNDDIGMCVPTVNCAAGKAGCECNSGSCEGDFACNEFNICVEPACREGEQGCRCNLGRCAAGFECTEGACVEKTCVPGSIGCPCAEGRCKDTNASCKPITVSGDVDICVVDANPCGLDNSEKCAAYCGGADKVAVCGDCQQDLAECLEESASSTTTTAIAMTITLLVAALV